MNKYFIQLFKEESTVILPGFGALTMTNEKSGEIMFMPYLKFDDGKLATYIAKTDGIEAQDAQNMIAKFIREIQAELDKGESFDIFEFGSFTKKADGEIEFTSDFSMGQGDKSASEDVPAAALVPETPYVEPTIEETPYVEPFVEYSAPIEETYVAPEPISEEESGEQSGEQSESESESESGVKSEKQSESGVKSEEESDEEVVKDKKDKKKDKKKEKKAKKKAKKIADSKDLINSILSGENIGDQSEEQSESESESENESEEQSVSESGVLGDGIVEKLSTLEDIVSPGIDDVVDGADQVEEITEEIKEVIDEPEAVEAKIDDLEHAKGDIVEDEITAALSEKGKTSKLDKKAFKKEKKAKKAAVVLDTPDGEEPTKKKRKRGLGFWLLLTFLLALLGGIAWVGMNFDQVKPHIPFLAEKKEPYVSPIDTSESIKIIKELSEIEESAEEVAEEADSLISESIDSPEKALKEAEEKIKPAVQKVEKEVVKPAKKTVKKVIKAVSEPVLGTAGSYHVVVGSFGDQRNAQKLVSELKSKGYNAVLAGKNPTGLHVVSAGLCADRAEAIVLLEKVKPLHSGAWLKKN